MSLNIIMYEDDIEYVKQAPNFYWDSAELYFTIDNYDAKDEVILNEIDRVAISRDVTNAPVFIDRNGFKILHSQISSGGKLLIVLNHYKDKIINCITMGANALLWLITHMTEGNAVIYANNIVDMSSFVPKDEDEEDLFWNQVVDINVKGRHYRTLSDFYDNCARR